jgi:hypothetical protein
MGLCTHLVHQAREHDNNVLELQGAVLQLACACKRGAGRREEDGGGTPALSCARLLVVQCEAASQLAVGLVVLYSRFPEQIPPDKNLATLKPQKPDIPRAQPVAAVSEELPPGGNVACAECVYERRELCRQRVLLQHDGVREAAEEERDGDQADENCSGCQL